MDQVEEGKQVEIPLSGIVYGETVYWVTIAGAVLVLVGSIITFVTDANYIAPGYLLSSIWEGTPVDKIWIDAVGSRPDGHWYLGQLTTGNGLTMAGIVLGVFSVIPGLLSAGVVLFKENRPLYGFLALAAATITIVSMLA